MSLFRPIHCYHSRADLIWLVGPFNESEKSFFSKTSGMSSRVHYQYDPMLFYSNYSNYKDQLCWKTK